MRKEIFNDGDVQIFFDEPKYLIRYEVGSHQIAIREDEISEEEVNRIVKDPSQVSDVLFSLQKWLQETGNDPYQSNV